MLAVVAVIAAWMGLGGTALAAPHEMPGTTYDPAIPSPTQALGFELGEHPVRHDQLVSYLSTLDRLSDRLVIEQIGQTHERRPILLLKVTSPANHARLEQLRTDHLARIEAGTDAPTDAPVFVWANYGVHGAEASGKDAVLATAYHLTAATGPEIERTLDTAVVLIVAILNPDGHMLRVGRVDRFGGQATVTDPAHHQHGGWGDARVNHYGFDLNRQWLLLSQPEAQAWVTAWQKWVPQVSLDHHEMGSNATFYFHPGEPKRVNALISQRQTDLADAIAQYHQRALDPDGVLYYAEEGFDNFYVGKGSTYPQVNGGVGILFEAGTAAGGAIETDNGLRTYAENIRLQFRTSLSSIAGAVALRRELRTSQARFFRDAKATARSTGPAAYVVAAPNDPALAQRFLAVLATHGVQAHVLAESLEAGGQRFEAGGAYVVPTAQRQAAMVRAIFETPTAFLENVFYDVSAWTLPLAYDLQWAPVARGAYRDRLLGALAQGSFTPAPVSAPEVGSYGYVLRWSDRYAPRALGRLLREGLRVRVAAAPFTASTPGGTASFDRGAVFVPAADQPLSAEALHALMSTVAAEDGVVIAPVVSGRTPTPGTDFGGRKTWVTIEEPEILLLFTGGTPTADAGEAWWLLDEQHHLPVTLRPAADLRRLDLSRYTHILALGGVASSFGAVEKAALTAWTEAGGVLVASGSAAQWAQSAFADDDEDEGGKDGADATDDPARQDYASMEVAETRDAIAGALFATDIDPSHPLGFGHGDRKLAVMKVGTGTLDWPAEDPFAVVARFDAEPLLAGYASAGAIAEVAGKPAVTAQARGSGTLILFADNPTFRGTSPGTERLLLNALFMNRHIRAPRSPDLSEDDHQSE
jgi:hypothetical protein